MSTVTEAVDHVLAEREKHLPYTLADMDAEAWFGGQKERVRATVARVAELEEEERKGVNDYVDLQAHSDRWQVRALKAEAAILDLRADKDTAANVTAALTAERDAALQKSHENANKAMQALDRAETAEARVAELEAERTSALREMGADDNDLVGTVEAVMNERCDAVSDIEEVQKERDGLREALRQELAATDSNIAASRMRTALAAIPAPDAASLPAGPRVVR